MRRPALFTAFVFVALSFHAAFSQVQSERVVAPVDGARRTPLASQVPQWAAPGRDIGAVAGGLKLEQLKVNLSRSPQREAAFQQLLKDQQDPASPRFRQWLSPEQIGAQYGPTKHDIAAVADWLGTRGLKVTEIAPSGLYVRFNGSADDVASAFGVAFHYYQSALTDNGRRISITREPSVPAALAGVVSSVSGLSQNVLKANHHVSRPQYTYTENGVEYNALYPADFATIYDVSNKTYTGSGQKIAIVGRSRVDATDYSNYRSYSGLSASTVTTVIPAGATDPGETNDGDQDEAFLDVTRSGSIATAATIDLVASASSSTQDGIDISIDYIVNSHSSLNANIMNISFGECEYGLGTATVQAYDSTFSQAAAEGITTFVSAADSGVASCETQFGTPTAEYEFASINGICASSYVTCLGGTEFNDPTESTYWNTSSADSTVSSAKSYIPEGAWNESGYDSSGATYNAGTGGGVSTVIAWPSWQTGTGVPAAHAGRYVPDIAFTAAEHDGYALCEAYLIAPYNTTCSANAFFVFAGTSAAAPDMAGVQALANQATGVANGNINPSLYALAAKTSLGAFHDITVASSGVTGCIASTPSICNNTTPGPTSTTSGNTPGFLVTAGYDEATGLGSLDVAKYVANFGSALPKNATTTIAVSVSPSTSFVEGTDADVTAKITASAGIPTGSVTIQVLAGMNLVQTLGSYTLSAVSGSSTESSVSTGQLPTSGVPPGTYTLKVIYPGASGFAASTSSGTNVTIAATTDSIALTPASQTVTRPNNVSITAKVTYNSIAPAGTITFHGGGEAFGPYPVTKYGTGTSTYYGYVFSTPTPTSQVPAGTVNATATYSGDTNYSSVTSAPVQVVLK